jgi:hypothetical protein
MFRCFAGLRKFHFVNRCSGYGLAEYPLFPGWLNLRRRYLPNHLFLWFRLCRFRWNSHLLKNRWFQSIRSFLLCHLFRCRLFQSNRSFQLKSRLFQLFH